MRNVLSLIRSRTAALLAACGLAMLQAACAHPVMGEPTVVVHARVGGPVHGAIYAPLYSPPPVVLAPQPLWVAPPPVFVQPRMWVPPGHRHHHGRKGHGHYPGGGRRGW